MPFNLAPCAGEPEAGVFRPENNLMVTGNGPDIHAPYPFGERLALDLHSLDAATGRTR